VSTSLSKRLATWRNGSAGFFQWLVDTKPLIPDDTGRFIPYVIPNQEVRDAIVHSIDGGFGTVVFCWPRRHGKTVVAALIIAWRFLTRPGQTIAIVANSEKQSVDTAFKTVAAILQKTLYSNALVQDGAIVIGAEAISYGGLGSTITGYPSSPASLYGKKLSVAQVSELHAAKSDAVFQVLASSTIDTADGLVLVDSTVGARSSPLYALNQLAERKEDPSLFFSHLSYANIEDAIARGPKWIAPARLRSRAAQMLPAEFAAQHLNLWGAASNALFPDALIDRTVKTYPLNVREISGNAAFVVGGGLDRAYSFSLHGDATVTTAVAKLIPGGEDEPHYYVLASDGVKFSTFGGISRNLTRYRRDFGMKRVCLEVINATDIASWAAEQDFESETVHPTPDRQAAAFTALHNAASEGRLHIHPSHKKLIAELRTFEYRLESLNGKSVPKFGAAGKRDHDDFVYSLGWAIYALREDELSPYALTGINCEATGPVVQLCVLNGGDHVPACSENCRSMSQTLAFYREYSSKNKIDPLDVASFYRFKVKNEGAHVVRR
jgi:hypothetical protein